MAAKLNITDLEKIVDSLPTEERVLFRRIYEVNTAVGELRVPEPMKPWVRKQFGSVEAVARQRIVRVTNLITLEESLFNRLRCSRPTQFKERRGLESRLSNASRNDLFSNPRDNTPEDLFGRISGRHCITASNVARYDGLHSVVIYNDFNPLHFTREQFTDYIDVGWAWAQRAHKSEPQAKYFFLIWNCLWRAGASIYHGHAQVMLAENRHYARVDSLRRAALDYRQRYRSSYFADLFRVHHSLGCALNKTGVEIIAHLTPFKDNGVIILADELNLSFKERLYEVLACFRDRLGVTSFNLGLTTPPLGETEESWEDFPVTAWLVDRGDPDSQTSDIGGMEIYAASVISSDPFELARRLRECLT